MPQIQFLIVFQILLNLFDKFCWFKSHNKRIILKYVEKVASKLNNDNVPKKARWFFLGHFWWFFNYFFN